MPIGTLTRNTHRQSMVTSRPPTTGPRAAATPPVAVQVRTADERRSGGTDASSRANEVGVRRAAPAACTTRKAIIIPTPLDNAHPASAVLTTSIC